MDSADQGTGTGGQGDPTEPRVLTSTVFRRIEHQLELAQTTLGEIDASTARAIARSVYRREGGALQRFAWSGGLNPAQVLAELDETPFDLLQVRWVLALTTFVEAAERPAAGYRDPARIPPHPAPRVYLTRPRGLFGRWVDLDAPETEVEGALAAVPPLSPHHGGAPGWQIHAAMGFWGFPVAADEDLCTDDDLWRLHDIARGIARHGEAYALYALRDLHVLPLSEDEFERRYYGLMSLEAFVLDRAEERGWLTAIDDLVERHALRGLLSLDIELAADLFFSEDWDRYPGTAGITSSGHPNRRPEPVATQRSPGN